MNCHWAGGDFTEGNGSHRALTAAVGELGLRQHHTNMDYPFTLPGHSDLNLSLRSGGLLTGAKILKDGVPLKRSKAVVLVPLADGSSLELKIKIGFDMFTPKILFAGQEIEVMPPLPAFWVVWAYLPLLLMFIGGAIGGLCGGAAAAGTLSVLRSDMPRGARILIAILAPPVAFFAYATAAFLILKLRQ